MCYLEFLSVRTATFDLFPQDWEPTAELFGKVKQLKRQCCPKPFPKVELRKYDLHC